MKIAYIAHPISGDQKRNVKKVLDIIKTINLKEPSVVPFAPYIPDCMVLDDSDPEQRERGIKNDIELFSRDIIDEIRLYGDKISNGMEAEIKLAEQKGIPVIPHTPDTALAYSKR